MTCTDDQDRPRLFLSFTSQVIATVHEFIGRRGGESRGVHHGYSSGSAVVFDSSTLLLGREDKKSLSLRGEYGLSVLHTDPEVRMR